MNDRLLVSLCTDCIENISFFVASVTVAATTYKRLLHNCLFRGRCTASGEYVMSLHQIAYSRTANSSFPEGYVFRSCNRSRLPSTWLGSHGDYSQIALASPSLRPIVPSGSQLKYQVVQMYRLFLQEWPCFHVCSS
jgi:hypothetical protein